MWRGAWYCDLADCAFFIALFFVVFTLTHLLVITPLFLATLNDAYAVRDEQMRQASERRAAREVGPSRPLWGVASRRGRGGSQLTAAAAPTAQR